jgi:soluble lytic murein transglycosylase-like protein
VRAIVTSVLVPLLIVGSVPAATAVPVGAAPTSARSRSDVGLLELASVRRLLLGMAPRRGSMSEGERAATLTDLSMVAEAVVGRSPVGPFTYDEITSAGLQAPGPRVQATDGVGARDALAYRLLALGYSAREAADIVSGRISQRALDTARTMIAVGQGREVAANYLDTQYRLVRESQRPRMSASVRRGSFRSTPFDPLIEKYASLHGVEAAVVRAIMATESAFNPMARSSKGAIGLMQLMPGTARELGVNPYLPEQNIEGGVRYFSQMLRMFGGLELALVAYNAGPGFAQRYARGQTALYGETRDYVRKVLGRLAGTAR